MKTKSYLRSRAVLLASILCLTTASFAQTTQDPATLKKAKDAFLAGARAYTKGEYEIALQAFEEANNTVRGAPVIFSIAQTQKKLFQRFGNASAVEAAIVRYKEYIQIAPDGDRRDEAEKSIEYLETEKKKMPAQTQATATAIRPKTLLSVSSNAEGAKFSIDADAKLYDAGDTEKVAAGKHKIRVTAPGYFDTELEQTVPEGGFITVPAVLKEKPAKLTFEGTNGARILVDGRDFGTTPINNADLAAGMHQVSALKNGHEAFSEEMEFQRGETKKVNLALRNSGQRTASYVLFAAGGTAVLAGTAFMLFGSLPAENNATDILNTSDRGDDALKRYDNARSERDTWRTISLVSYGIGAAALVSGLVLYAFDTPTVASAARKDDKVKPATKTNEPESMMRGIGFAPVVAPTTVGATVYGRF